MRPRRIGCREAALAAVTTIAIAFAAWAGSAQAAIVYLPKVFFLNGQPIVRLLPSFLPDPEPPGMLPGLPMVSGDAWDETAVRQVMRVFAFGGLSSDEQVRIWADMAPDDAIAEMLTFDERNEKLAAPLGDAYDLPADVGGTLHAVGSYLFGDTSPLPESERSRYDPALNGSAWRLFLYTARLRGLNPFRQKIGLFETNYHMAVNQRAGVSSAQVIRYYDDIMQAHADGLPYERVINTAALSAAVARQYGHDRNRWRYRRRLDAYECVCNDDFAREYHQLFFGILGTADPEYHEGTSIENTALALTDMHLYDEAGAPTNRGAVVEFGTEQHHIDDVEILGRTIAGGDAAEKVGALSDIAIEHYESLATLPVLIVSTLADDALDGDKIARLRRAWRSMPEKNLLDFLRAYAVSTLFHAPTRLKYMTSIDRYLTIANTAFFGNAEVYANVPQVFLLTGREGVQPFEPEHDVFGHQTGLEAAASSDIFRRHWNVVTDTGNHFHASAVNVGDVAIARDWAPFVPREADGSIKVASVARWLWERMIGDGGDHYGPHERAQLHALLAEGDALGYLLDEDAPDVAFDASELLPGTPVGDLVAALGERSLELDSEDAAVRNRHTRRVGQAAAFIAVTPFMFAAVGR